MERMKILCIGAGASGLFFALNAAQRGHEVLVLETNEKPGRKLSLTGKGRCNVTNCCETSEVIKNIVSNPRFLYSALSRWTPQQTMAFFEENGCPLKVERGNRVFPVSDQSADIVSCLVRLCAANGVTIRYKERVRQTFKDNGHFYVVTNKGRYEGDALVIATGGRSYPLTGSLGDGYVFAKSFGHTIIDPVSALCPLRIKETIYPELLRFTLKNVALSAKGPSFKKSLFGDLEFFPGALGGPIALSMSSYINRLGPLSMELDFKPALDEAKLDARLLREVEKAPNENVSYLLSRLLPTEILPFFFEKADMDQSRLLCELKREERKKILALLKRFPLTYLGLESIDKGIITSGGVNTKEIDSKTLESKLVKGLYFIGEVIDVDALTGGFNLQIAFATAFAAAYSIE